MQDKLVDLNTEKGMYLVATFIMRFWTLNYVCITQITADGINRRPVPKNKRSIADMSQWRFSYQNFLCLALIQVSTSSALNDTLLMQWLKQRTPDPIKTSSCYLPSTHTSVSVNVPGWHLVQCTQKTSGPTSPKIVQYTSYLQQREFWWETDCLHSLSDVIVWFVSIWLP